MTSVTIGSGVETIGAEAFSGCTGMISLTTEATTPPACGADAFDCIDKEGCTLYVPTVTVDLYKEADQWKDFLNITDGTTTGISVLTSDTERMKEVDRYNTNGQRVDTPQRGVNIVRYSDGSVKKVYVK